MAIYLKYGAIEGNVTTQGFEKWIELNSCQFGVGRGISMMIGKGTAREASIPSISEVVVTKVMDSASNKLFLDAVGGSMDTLAKITFTTTDKTDTTGFLTYELTNTGISGFSTSSGGDRPSESLSLNFTKVTISYTDKDSAVGGAADTVGYDLQTGTTV